MSFYQKFEILQGNKRDHYKQKSISKQDIISLRRKVKWKKKKKYVNNAIEIIMQQRVQETLSNNIRTKHNTQ